MAKLKILDTMTRGFMSWAYKAGLMFGGSRDIYKVYGYDRHISFIKCYQRYARQDIAKRIVDAPADAVWTQPPIWDTADKIGILCSSLHTKFGLWDVLNRADKLAGMGRYSTILIGLDDGKPLNEPVVPNSKINVIFLQPYAETQLRVSTLETDQKNSRFGKPKMYTLYISATDIFDQTMGGDPIIRPVPAGIQTQVHWTRVLHIADSILQDEILGHPRLESVYNLLDDMLKVAGGSAEIYWLNSRAGMQVDVDKEMNLEEDDAEALSAEVDDYVNNLRRVVRTRGVKMNVLNSTLNDPKNTFTILLQLISSATGIPLRILIGSEAGSLASEQDRANWATHVEERRENFAKRIISALIQMFLLYGLVDQVAVDATDYSWPDAFRLSPLERGQTSAQMARTATNITKALDQMEKLMSVDEARRIIVLAFPQIFQPGKMAGDRPGKNDNLPAIPVQAPAPVQETKIDQSGSSSTPSASKP